MLISAAFHLLHLAVIMLNMLCWAHPALRKPGLAMQAVTLACWLGYGLFDGRWGFCPLTYWHWQWLETLGEIGLPNNYITYIARHWFGLHMNGDFAAGLVLGCFVMAVTMNLVLLCKERKRAA